MLVFICSEITAVVVGCKLCGDGGGDLASVQLCTTAQLLTGQWWGLNCKANVFLIIKMLPVGLVQVLQLNLHICAIYSKI